MAGGKKLRATRTTELDCSGHWMVDAIQLNTDLKSRTRRSRKWRSKAPGIVRRLPRTTVTGRRRIPRRARATGSAPEGTARRFRDPRRREARPGSEAKREEADGTSGVGMRFVAL